MYALSSAAETPLTDVLILLQAVFKRNHLNNWTPVIVGVALDGQKRSLAKAEEE